MSKFLGKAFGFDAEKHNVRTEIVAGITTFLTMAYILAVNPSIFSALDMPKGAVFTATALAALIGTLVMAFYAKKPFALAPGMGLNAFFVFTVCLTMGHSWQFALTAVFLEGLLFIILTLTKVRSWILNAIPLSLKHAIGAGIGLFIAFIGLQNAGIIANNDSTLVALGDITHGAALLGIIGIVITGALVILKVKGSILIGILVTAIIGLFIKDPASGTALTKFSGVISAPDSVAPIFMKFEWTQILSWDMLAVVFTFLFIDMFDTMGTIIGVSQKAGMVDEKGNVDGIDKMFMADSIATVCGACLGTSTTTTYVESHRLHGRDPLRPGPPLLPDLPRHPRRRHGSGPRDRGCDDDEPGREDRLGGLLREHPGVHHRADDARRLLHLRRYPPRRDLLRRPERPRRQVQEDFSDDVGARRTVHLQVHLYLNGYLQDP